MSIRFIAHYFCLKLRYSKNKARILFYLMLINDFDLKRRKEKLGLILRSYIYLSSLKKRMADSKNRTGSSDFSKERLAILGFQLWISLSCFWFGRIELAIARFVQSRRNSPILVEHEGNTPTRLMNIYTGWICIPLTMYYFCSTGDRYNPRARHTFDRARTPDTARQNLHANT